MAATIPLMAKNQATKSKKSDPTPELTPKRRAVLLSVDFDELGIDMLWTVTQLKQMARTPAFAPRVRLAAVQELEQLRREALDSLENYVPRPAATASRPERRIGRKFPA